MRRSTAQSQTGDQSHLAVNASSRRLKGGRKRKLSSTPSMRRCLNQNVNSVHWASSGLRLCLR